jgi:DNA-binding NarL/FixJ family response regulator
MNLGRRVVSERPSHWSARDGKPLTRRVLIIDDQPIYALGLRVLLGNEEGIEVCGVADSAHSARAAIKQHNPHAVIIDISLSSGDGIGLLRDICAHHPALPLLVLSAHDENIYAGRMLAAGADGYVSKHAPDSRVRSALRRILTGGVAVSEQVANQMIEKLANGASHTSADPIDQLSTRELQVLRLIGKGLSTRETAAMLNLSPKTIESHRQRIKRKINTSTSAQFVRFAVTWLAASEGEQRAFVPACREASGLERGQMLERGGFGEYRDAAS